jgi:hypothetical protein
MKTGDDMKLNRLTIIGCFIALLAPALATHSAAQSGESGDLKTNMVEVRTFDGLSVIPTAGASLSRNNDGAFMTFHTSGLTPGNVVTLWWAFFNNPKNCATQGCSPADLANPLVNASLQYGGGRIVGIDGSVSFGGFLAVGDNTGFEIRPGMPNPAPGLVRPNKATIHLVVRSHGPASTDPTVLSQQLTSFGGGCSTANPCSNIQAAVFRSN